MAALVVAGTGARVVKHGNRAASSACGAADVLEALGLRLDLPPDRVAELATEVGITFCFAPVFHPAMRHAGPTRRELGVPTVFNVLGPLTNPAQPAAAAVGVRRPADGADRWPTCSPTRGVQALVFRGDDGLDELTTTTATTVWVVGAGTVRPRPARSPRRRHDPRRARRPARRRRGAQRPGGPRRARRRRGPVRDAVLLNAAAALVAADGTAVAGRLADAMIAALDEVGEALDDGRAGAVLDRWVSASRA